MATYDDTMSGLRARVQRVIGENAVALAQHSAGRQAKPQTPPEKQWWNVPAKLRAAERIKREMLRDYPGWNDAGDAARHAELSRRMASEIDPLTSYAAGVAHELDNEMPASWAHAMPAFLGPLKQHAMDNWHSQDRPEAMMDLRNNAEGRAAAREGRPVDPRHLQTSPRGSAPPGAAYQPNRTRPR